VQELTPKEIDKWPASDYITFGEECSNGEYTFVVVAKSPGTYVELLTPVEEVWVDSDALARGIRGKVSRYAGLAEQLDAPLIVVVGADDTLAVVAEAATVSPSPASVSAVPCVLGDSGNCLIPIDCFVDPCPHVP